MTTPQAPFMDYSELTPFPARPTTPRRRPAWVVGLLVMAWVTAAGALLGPVAAVVLYDLAPLYPLTILLGAVVGATYGLFAGVLLGFGSAVVVAVVREARQGGAAG